MRLQLEPHQIGDVVVIKCTGRIVAGPESEALDARLNDLLLESKHIVLHLGSVDFVDSTGLGTLVRLLGATRALHGDLKLCDVPTAVAYTLRITALHTLLEMHDSEVDAIAAFYQRKLTPHGSLRAGTPVLCVDGSEDMLACLRELLRGAGYAPVTTSNPCDARILSKATRPVLIILGPNPVAQPGAPDRAFRQALGGIPLLELESSFSTCEAGEAAQNLLEQVRSRAGVALKKPA